MQIVKKNLQFHMYTPNDQDIQNILQQEQKCTAVHLKSQISNYTLEI